jgi:hypothetical protein
MGGAADSTDTSEVERRHFQHASVARRWARAQVTRAGGRHAALVFAGRPTSVLDEHLASYESAARRAFLTCCAESTRAKYAEVSR